MPKISVYILIMLLSFTLKAQTPIEKSKAGWASGEVIEVKQGESILLKITAEYIDVHLGAVTIFRKISPENPKITAAIESALSEISKGDKILVTGIVSAGKKSITAQTIYLVTKSDLAQKLSVERNRWQTHGVAGKVVAIDLITQQITLAIRSLQGEIKVILLPKENAEYLRYATDSAKFADAVSGSLADVKIGNQLRAMGEKSADGLIFLAEKYLFGSFKMLAGNIKSLDIAKNELTITDMQSKKLIVISLKNNTVLKKFPPEIAQMMAMQMQAEKAQPQTVKPTRRNFDEMLERLPNLNISELKIGDAIGISCIIGTTPDKYTAVKLLSGVEPFLKPPQIAKTGGNNATNQPQTINIPGLENIEN